MNVSLTPELERFVDDKVESGLYNNSSEVIPGGPATPQGARRGPAAVARADRERLAGGTVGARHRRPEGDGCGARAPEAGTQEASVTPRYRLTPTAQANVDDMYAFIANDSVDAALKVLDALGLPRMHLSRFGR